MINPWIIEELRKEEERERLRDEAGRTLQLPLPIMEESAPDIKEEEKSNNDPIIIQL